MFEEFLTTTYTEGLQPLGTAAQRSFELVSSAVRTRLGAEHAAIFAEPVASPHGDRVDWHAPVGGDAEPFSDLDKTEKAALRERLGTLVGGIRAEAARLAASDSPDDQRLAEALENATEIPGEEMIWALRSESGALRPVLVHWAWVRDEQRAVRGVLSAMVPRHIAAPPPVASAAKVDAADPARGSRSWWWLLLWLGWLLLAVLIGAILWLLIAPCALNPGRFGFCPADPARIEAALTESRVAADEVALLEREIALSDRQCQPTIPVQPLTPVPAQAPGAPPVDKTEASPDGAERAEVARRVTERGGARGELNFTLEWATIDDVDLYVTCPKGPTVSYRNPRVCNGVYDLDANVVRDAAIGDPVENIVFNDAPLGLYKVRAHLRSERTKGPKEVILHVLRRDGPSQSYKGMVGDGTLEWTTNISISR